jgi:phenylalanyl-tRNA synthetase beta chain
MKITWNWLSEFVELDMTPAELAERLTMSGLEVESVETKGAELAKVVCAEVVVLKPHPGADRLRVCEVRCGADETVSVVCGAPNVAAGQRVAFAPAGVVLPGGTAIEATEIRGVASAGMLCSEVELGIGADGAGILVLPEDAPLGEPVGRIVGVEDTVLDISITPNRGDCMSVLGIAREVAALTGVRLNRQRFSVAESVNEVDGLVAISIEDPELCRRYAGRVIGGVRIAPSPLWLRSRLRAVGLRPINNVVDVTNFVMIERGQPLHAFDYDRLPKPAITVRRARDIRTITTLDGQQRLLEPDDLLITSGGEGVAIAGVMGGADSEVEETTTRILLESAWFQPASIRRTSKRLGLRSEASYRFERGTDIEGIVHAADRAAELITEVAGGDVARGCADEYAAPYQPAPIALRVKRTEEMLGVAVNRDEATSRLKAFGMSVSPAISGTLTVVPPSYRVDLVREVDLIEEIARSIGYEKMPSTLPECSLAAAGLSLNERRERDIKRYLISSGLCEALSLSFCTPDENGLFPGIGSRKAPVPVLNPVTQEDSQMRLSLSSGLLRCARANIDQGNGEFAGFSMGKVFWRGDDGGFLEAKRLAAVVCPRLPVRGVGNRKQSMEFGEFKGIVEGLFDSMRVTQARWRPASDLASFHPGKSAYIEVGGSLAGYAGLLHPNTAESLKVDPDSWVFELDLDGVLEYCPARVVFEELPRFPVVVRDVAILADVDFQSDRIDQFVRHWDQANGLIEAVQLFDQYVGDAIPAGKKSLAYSVAYRAAERTLTDAEVNEVHAKLVAALQDSLGVTLR